MNKTNPKAILKVAKTKKFRSSFIDFVRRLERKDGLRLRDFVEAEITDEGLKASKMPTMLVVRENLSKAKQRSEEHYTSTSIWLRRWEWRGTMRGDATIRVRPRGVGKRESGDEGH